MNILHFINLSHLGGIERQFQRFITFFNKRRGRYADYDHSVLSYLSSIHKDLSEDINKSCERVHIFKKTFPDLFFHPLIRPLRCSHLFKANSYDVLITKSFLKNCTQKRTIEHFPGLNLFYDEGWSTNANPEEDLSIFDGFIVNSTSTMETLIKKFAVPSEYVKVLHNSYPEHFDAIDRPEEKALVRKRLNVSKSDKIVLGLGRFRFMKGFTVLIEAFRYIKSLGTKLLLVGDGKIRPVIQQLIDDYQLGDRVMVVGHSSKPVEFYRASDLFVLPSCREPFGIVLLEAAILKIPIIANDLDGVRDTIRDESFGYLIPPEKAPADFPYINLRAIPEEVYYPGRDELAPPLFPEPKKLAEQIEYALEHHSESNAKAERLYKRVKDEFSIKRYTDSLHAIISDFYRRPHKDLD